VGGEGRKPIGASARAGLSGLCTHPRLTWASRGIADVLAVLRVVRGVHRGHLPLHMDYQSMNTSLAGKA
jgi:hypothetical protein